MEVATARVAGAAWAPGNPGAVNRLRSDSSLIARFQAGDESAFSALYDRYKTKVEAICLGVLRSREDALDASQEVFATVAVKLRERPPDDLKPWLAKVARNAAIDAARRRRIAVEIDEENTASGGGAEGAGERQLELQELLGSLSELPEQQRTALVMRELGGWSYDEIGASLGIDGHAVNGLIARARISLRTKREASALVCSAVRETLAAEADGRRRPAPIRRHLRCCRGCTDFNLALRSDARTLRALLPGGGIGIVPLLALFRPRAALVGGVGAAKVALGGGAAQVAAICAVGVCTVGGVSVLDVLPDIAGPVSREQAPGKEGKTSPAEAERTTPTAERAVDSERSGDSSEEAPPRPERLAPGPGLERPRARRPGPDGGFAPLAYEYDEETRDHGRHSGDGRGTREDERSDDFFGRGERHDGPRDAEAGLSERPSDGARGAGERRDAARHDAPRPDEPAGDNFAAPPLPPTDDQPQSYDTWDPAPPREPAQM